MAKATIHLREPLRFLTPREIRLIDDFLVRMQTGGELRLVVQKGRLRFLASSRNHQVMDLRNGTKGAEGTG